jgi:hypothetical protein
MTRGIRGRLSTLSPATRSLIRAGRPGGSGTSPESPVGPFDSQPNDILAEAAGITAGSWYAWPSTHVGYELIGAAMLILAGGGNGRPTQLRRLERWTRVGYERGMRSRKGER